MPGVALERRLPSHVPSEPTAPEIHEDDDEALVAESVVNNILLAGSAGVPGVGDLHSPEQLGGLNGAQECVGAQECEMGLRLLMMHHGQI